MYIKVHKESNQWFRDDNGTLVGKDVFSIKEIHSLRIRYDARIFAKNNDKIHPIFEGYFDYSGNFIHYCYNWKKCSSCTEDTRTIFCNREHSTLKHKSSGYYISSSD